MSVQLRIRASIEKTVGFMGYRIGNPFASTHLSQKTPQETKVRRDNVSSPYPPNCEAYRGKFLRKISQLDRLTEYTSAETTEVHSCTHLITGSIHTIPLHLVLSWQHFSVVERD